MLQANHPWFGRVLRKTQQGPMKVRSIRAARDYLADSDRILYLLQHEGRKHRQYLQCRRIGELFEALEQRWVGEFELGVRAQVLIGVVVGLRSVRIHR